MAEEEEKETSLNPINFTDSMQNEFDHVMRDQLPPQAILYLKATGFDSEKTFASFDTSCGPTDSFQLIVKMMRTQIELLRSNMTPEEVKLMYGIFHAKPEAFQILPGHRAVIHDFASKVRASREQQSYEVQFKMASNASFYEQLEPVEITEHEEKLKTPDETLYQLRESMDSYFKTSIDFRDSNVKENEHYTIIVTPTAPNEANNYHPVAVLVKCMLCNAKLKLPVVRSKFRPANFYRHIKCCVLKRTRGANKKGKHKDSKKDEMDSIVKFPCENPSQNGVNENIANQEIEKSGKQTKCAIPKLSNRMSKSSGPMIIWCHETE